MRALAGLLLAFLIASAAGVHAAELPALTGRVVDAAEMIEASDETALTQTLAEFEARSSDQIVVATIPSLDGEAIEPFANRLFRAWGLGQAGEDNGVLLIVARDDRKMRIEVGYGLEGTLTDLHSRLIIENALVPAFRAGQFGPGIREAVADIIEVLSGDGAELQARYERNAEQQDEAGVPLFVWIFVTIWALLFFGGFAMALMVPMFGRKIGPRRYRWLGTTFDFTPKPGGRSSGWSTGGGFSGGGRSSGGGFSGGGGSSGGGGASGSW